MFAFSIDLYRKCKLVRSQGKASLLAASGCSGRKFGLEYWSLLSEDMSKISQGFESWTYQVSFGALKGDLCTYNLKRYLYRHQKLPKRHKIDK